MTLEIACLLKQVPLPSEMRMGSDGLMDRTTARSMVNNDCSFALEQALELKDRPDGKPVRPKVYVAVAISGAVRHLAGVKDSKSIVAVNKPILRNADFGLVGDYRRVLPILIERVRRGFTFGPAGQRPPGEVAALAP